MRVQSLGAAGLALACWTMAAPASADGGAPRAGGDAGGATAGVAAESPAGEGVGSPAASPWEVRVAYRGAWVEDAGYAPFSSNDYFPQASLGASRVLFARGRFALSVGLGWDYGETGDAARGQPSSLSSHRFTVPLTMRFALLRGAMPLEVFAAVAPGAALEEAQIQEASAPAMLGRSQWLPCGDASLGARWGLFEIRPDGHPVTFWLTAEGGYAWSAPMDLSLVPDAPQGAPRQATDLGTVAMSGGFARTGIAVTF